VERKVVERASVTRMQAKGKGRSIDEANESLSVTRMQAKGKGRSIDEANESLEVLANESLEVLMLMPLDCQVLDLDNFSSPMKESPREPLRDILHREGARLHSRSTDAAATDATDNHDPTTTSEPSQMRPPSAAWGWALFENRTEAHVAPGGQVSSSQQTSHQTLDGWVEGDPAREKAAVTPVTLPPTTPEPILCVTPRPPRPVFVGKVPASSEDFAQAHASVDARPASASAALMSSPRHAARSSSLSRSKSSTSFGAVWSSLSETIVHALKAKFQTHLLDAEELDSTVSPRRESMLATPSSQHQATPSSHPHHQSVMPSPYPQLAPACHPLVVAEIGFKGASTMEAAGMSMAPKGRVSSCRQPSLLDGWVEDDTASDTSGTLTLTSPEPILCVTARPPRPVFGPVFGDGSVGADGSSKRVLLSRADQR